MIEVRNIRKKYGRVQALDDFNLLVPRGAAFGLVGPNGAGKSTLLKILATLIRPDAGTATIDGESVVREPRSVRRATGYQPDVPGLYQQISVEQYLAFFAAAFHLRGEEKARAIELVSSQYGAGTKAAVSPEIVRALTTTLKKDENPGVRKKAASALAGFPITPEIRAALLDALAHDRNPAVRLTAVEALAASARQAPADERTIESLRQKAFDPSENGFVRAKAASALKAMEF